MKPDPEGLPAVTTWKVMGRTCAAPGEAAPGEFLPAATLEPHLARAEPLTGRTHQLRVHCAAAGWPIVGDDIYGNGAALSAGRCCICTRARSWCRSPRTSQPVRVSRAGAARTCGSGCEPADGATMSHEPPAQ